MSSRVVRLRWMVPCVVLVLVGGWLWNGRGYLRWPASACLARCGGAGFQGADWVPAPVLRSLRPLIAAMGLGFGCDTMAERWSQAVSGPSPPCSTMLADLHEALRVGVLEQFTDARLILDDLRWLTPLTAMARVTIESVQGGFIGDWLFIMERRRSGWAVRTRYLLSMPH